MSGSNPTDWPLNGHYGRTGIGARLDSLDPVGVPAPGATGATVAVKVTICPATDGFGEEVTMTPVPAFTIWVSAAAALLLAPN